MVRKHAIDTKIQGPPNAINLPTNGKVLRLYPCQFSTTNSVNRATFTWQIISFRLIFSLNLYVTEMLTTGNTYIKVSGT